MDTWKLIGLMGLNVLVASGSSELNKASYAKQAHDWVNNYICTDDGVFLVSYEDVRSIANLLYFSYYRSKITLDAQESGLRALSSVWQRYENVISLRLNPSNEVPYAALDLTDDTSQFFVDADQHQRIGKAYAHIVDAVAGKNSICSLLAQESVQCMRNDARMVIMQALMDVRNLLGSLYAATRTQAVDYADTIVRMPGATESLSFIEYISAYIPRLAVLSFVEADTFNNKISREGWNTLMAIQHVSYKTWRTIEEARASLYKAYYTALYKVLQDRAVPEEYTAIIVDHKGLRKPEERMALLPSGAELSV
jgi:hypothetical protein